MGHKASEINNASTMAKVLLLSLASVLVSAQQQQFIQQQEYNQEANFLSPRDPSLSFNYGYEINDKDTGDAKTHQEALENGVLRGSYSVVQPDGNRRIVEYEADEVSGFQAKVRYEPGYPVQTPPQRRPSAGGAASSQGSSFSSGSSSRGSSSRGSSSSGSSLRRPRPNRPPQGAQFSGSQQGSRLTGGVTAQRPRIQAGAPQGPRFRPPGPQSQGVPSRFIGGSPQTSQFQDSRISSQSLGQISSSSFAGSLSQNHPSGSAGISTSQGSQSRPSGFSGSRTSSLSSGQSSSSSFAGPLTQSRPTGSAGVSASQGSPFRPLPQLPAGITSSSIPQSGAHGSSFNSGSSSQSSLVSSQNTFSSTSSQAGESSFSRPGSLPQRISQAGPPPSVSRPVSPGSPRPRPGAPALRRPSAPIASQPNTQGDIAVQIAPEGFFSQRGTPSSSASAAQSGAPFGGISGAPSQAGISGSSFGTSSHSGFSGAAFQQDRSSSSFQSGAPLGSIQGSNAFQQDRSSSSFQSGASSGSIQGSNAFQQDRSSSRYQSGAPSVSIQANNAFQSGQGSRFQGGPAFDQLISSSLLVTDENLDSIEAVELASAGFDDSSYAYRLVPVPVNN